MVISVVVILILFFLSAFFSGAEAALLSVNRIRIIELVKQGDKRAILVDSLLKDQIKLLTTILIGNNLVNIAASALTTSMAITLFGSSGVGIATGVVTFVILLFGEIFPKSLAKKNSVKYTKQIAPYLYWLEKLLTPVITFFTIIIKYFIGEENIISTSFLSEEEIRRFVNVSEGEGIIKRAERKMINSIFEFDDTIVKEVMVPRIDMVCINESASLLQFIDLALEKGHSRIPVYQKNIDNITGVIYVKDMLNLLLETDKNISLQSFIRPAYYIPESMKINTLLTEMKKRKNHIAIVLDEYGGTAGLITIEDLIEEIVGDIQDEYDMEKKQIEVINKNEILVDARMDMDELNEILPEPLLGEEDYETIGGYVLYHLGYFPKEGEKLELAGLIMKVEKIHEHRIENIKIESSQPFKLSFLYN